MGCLNANQGFTHWFGNIHFSGPCNRKCYFCIGQHMMGLDALNNLDKYPLDGLEEFTNELLERGIREVNLTGTNTDPLLYKHILALKYYLKHYIPNLVFGVRTNGVAVLKCAEWDLFDKGSISFPSFDPLIYSEMMGSISVPDMALIYKASAHMDLKVNICLSKINAAGLLDTIQRLSKIGFRKINVRELYGQPRYGNPFAPFDGNLIAKAHGMPTYKILGAQVTYWDVHFVEVESVNLYANGNVSIDYPITRGYDERIGEVKPQEQFLSVGRVNEQWVKP